MTESGAWNYVYPMGLQFMGSIEDQVDNNLMLCTVTRYKRSNDLGLWNFQYGRISSRSSSHVFREPDNGIEEDIKPALPAALTNFCDWITALFDGGGFSGDWWSFLDTERHLFETELTTTF
jgi:hypothetical protein